MDNKTEIIKLMKNLDFPGEIIEEYVEGNILPLKRDILDKITKAIKKMLSIDKNNTITIYDEDTLKKIDEFYKRIA